MNKYTANNLLTLSCAVTVVATGAPIDPTTVTLKVQLPDSSIDDISSSIVHNGTGNFSAPYLPTAPGLYTYEWIGTGAAEVAALNRFTVDPATF